MSGEKWNFPCFRTFSPIVSTCIYCNRALTAESFHVLPPLPAEGTMLPPNDHRCHATIGQFFRVSDREEKTHRQQSRKLIRDSRELLQDTAKLVESDKASSLGGHALKNALTPDEVDLVSRVTDVACERLDCDEGMRASIAARVVGFANRGERRYETLLAFALAATTR